MHAIVEGKQSAPCCSAQAELEQERAKANDLAMLAKQLVRELRKASPDNLLASLSVDYLMANGLLGDALRGLENHDV